jgi:hypothetical protein
MSKESYARGFCKVAEAAGVDPVALAKFAQVPPIKGKRETIGPTVRNAEHQQMLDNLDKNVLAWQKANPPAKAFAQHATGFSLDKLYNANRYQRLSRLMKMSPSMLRALPKY